MADYIDLHTHSSASDGQLSPYELVCHAKNAGLSAIALTDHDTVSGIAEAMRAGEDIGLEVIPGIELSADYPREMHILGLFVDPASFQLQQACTRLYEFRAKRNRRMLEKMRTIGLAIDDSDVLRQKPGAEMESIGRVHMALALIQKGYATDVADAFDRYLGKGSAAYVERERFSPVACIDLIHAAGGYAFLAHPIYSENDPERLIALVSDLKKDGLDGVECFHSAMADVYSNRLIELCRQYDLMICGGSDFHGANKPRVKIGQAYGMRFIDAQVLKRIKQVIGMD